MNPPMKRAFTTISTLAAGALITVSLACSSADQPEQPTPASHTPIPAAAATTAPTSETAPSESAAIAEARSTTEALAAPESAAEQPVTPTPPPTSNKPPPPTITPVPTPTVYVPPPTPAGWYPERSYALAIQLPQGERGKNQFEQTWGPWEFGMIDHDGDCQDSRQELLIEKSLVPVTFTDPQEMCEVATGLWEDAFTKDRWDDPNVFVVVSNVPPENVYQNVNLWHPHVVRHYIDVPKEHYVPDRKFSSKFGGVELGKNLRLVSTATKADRAGHGPDEWRPDNRQHWCEYAHEWIHDKYMWRIDTPQPEADALIEMLDTCEDLHGFTPTLQVLEP